ncbi:MAG: Mrp/NBP35 family ATP-binding protein [Thermodesulfovibrio sp.]|uniref:Mrp/NBP35 family ATP-binding protein n=1 Tax=unclassified Thermodesulfovibrio TaxID=2645936 RepID=UPI00083B3244|nr:MULTISPECIES: Mrp/NBP35 family ATP-binding protein [unclassified Thermodesulfovibrio]MDI1472008.1 Mrp/NBP35 family ATP-binding protein [Thermodesulfovibrio sp. 1176]MDI6715199.1 Mrp/NBP35 family ATP-binding protein [Thermodesulfovibrio sp.]ODA45235.1 Cytosolic Fe-S cluster assembling factor NBP35 [Thermodesulfovibrio sp. N1]
MKLTEERKSCQCEEREQVKREVALRFNLNAIKKKFLVLSGKGGVGKSTVSTNLAAGLSVKGYKVGLLDIDIHGPNIPNMFGLEGHAPIVTDLGIMPLVYSETLKLISVGFFLEQRDQAVVWRGPIKHRLIENFLTDVRWGELDFLVIDSPPGTGDEIISIVQILDKVDGAIIVATPQDVALADVRRTLRFCKDASIPILGIVENMSGFICPHCGNNVEIFKTGGAEKLAEQYKVPFLGRIPIDPQIVSNGDEGKPFMLFYPDSAPAKAFSNIVKKVVEAL